MSEEDKKISGSVDTGKWYSGLKSFWFWFWLVVIFIAGCAVAVVATYYTIHLLVQSYGLLGGFVLVGSAGSLITIFTAVLCSTVATLVLKKYLKIKFRFFIFLVLFFFAIPLGANFYQSVILRTYTRIVNNIKIDREQKTYGNNAITSDNQIVYNGSGDVKSQGDGTFLLSGQDDSDIGRDSNNRSLVKIKFDNNSYTKEKIVDDVYAIGGTYNGKAYWVNKDLFEIDMKTKEKKTLTKDVYELRETYRDKIVIRYANGYSVYDIATGRLNDIPTTITSHVEKNDGQLLFGARYIYYVVNSETTSQLKSYDIIDGTVKLVESTIWTNKFYPIASSDKYLAYSLYDSGTKQKIFKVIDTTTGAIKFSVAKVEPSDYYANMELVGDFLFASKRNAADGNQDDLVKINLTTGVEQVVLNLSREGSGKLQWSTDGEYVLLSTSDQIKMFRLAQ